MEERIKDVASLYPVKKLSYLEKSAVVCKLVIEFLNSDMTYAGVSYDTELFGENELYNLLVAAISYDEAPIRVTCDDGFTVYLEKKS